MAKFEFRLATLLKLRIAERDERRSELAEALKALAIIDERTGQIESEVHLARSAVQQAVGEQTVAVDTLLDNQRYELQLMAEKKAAEEQREKVAVETDRRRSVLVEADRQVKTLEKLRDREHQQHRVREERREAKQIDEVAVRTHAMRAVQL
ncbi:MAG: flagellar export protein FliJ [Pirellulales bacterium]|nr:flagellar export protein FliJ [Pirellulales bacterium]